TALLQTVLPPETIPSLPPRSGFRSRSRIAFGSPLANPPDRSLRPELHDRDGRTAPARVDAGAKAESGFYHAACEKDKRQLVPPAPGRPRLLACACSQPVASIRAQGE